MKALRIAGFGIVVLPFLLVGCKDEKSGAGGPEAAEVEVAKAEDKPVAPTKAAGNAVPEKPVVDVAEAHSDSGEQATAWPERVFPSVNSARGTTPAGDKGGDCAAVAAHLAQMLASEVEHTVAGLSTEVTEGYKSIAITKSPPLHAAVCEFEEWEQPMRDCVLAATNGKALLPCEALLPKSVSDGPPCEEVVKHQMKLGGMSEKVENAEEKALLAEMRADFMETCDAWTVPARKCVLAQNRADKIFVCANLL